MRAMIPIAAAVVLAAGCHNSNTNGAPSPATCDPNSSQCPVTGATGTETGRGTGTTTGTSTGTGTATGTGTTGSTGTGTTTNQPPTTTPPSNPPQHR